MTTFENNPAQTASSRSRIIFMTEIEVFGGAERSCLALSRWLYEHQLPHHFLLYKDHINVAAMASHPIRVVELRPRMRAFSKVRALRDYLSTFDSNAPKLLASGYQSALHAGLAGAKGFHTLMLDTPSLIGRSINKGSLKVRLRSRLTNYLIGRGLRSGGRTIVNSEYLRQETHDVFSFGADIVRMGGMVEKLNFRIRLSLGHLRMLSVSRVESNKRVDWMLRALATLESSAPRLSQRVSWHLDVIGKGSLVEPLRKISQDLGLAERVQFHGFLSDEELERKFEETHLFLMPAVQGYGLPALEALYRGIPVFLHRESGVSDILLDTPWATVIHGGEESMVDGLNQAIESVLSGKLATVPLPPLPTENGWAEEVVDLCGWK